MIPLKLDISDVGMSNGDYSADGSADGYYSDDYSWYEGAYTDDPYAYYGAYDGYGYYE